MRHVHRIPSGGTAARLAFLAVAVSVFAATATLAWAVENGAGPGPGYTVVGPFFNQAQKDASTCGNVWASGPFTQSYKVFPRRPDGAYLVVVSGVAHYVSVSGPSIGACNGGAPSNGNTIGDGVKVVSTQQGMFLVDNGTFDPTARCMTVNPSCFIGSFTTSFFGPSATFRVLSAQGIYESRCNGSWAASNLIDVDPSDTGDITGVRVPRCEGSS